VRHEKRHRFGWRFDAAHTGEKKFGTSSWMAVLGAGPWKNR